jgi:hypothetical protein
MHSGYFIGFFMNNLPGKTMSIMMARSRWEIDIMVHNDFWGENICFLSIFILC